MTKLVVLAVPLVLKRPPLAARGSSPIYRTAEMRKLARDSSDVHDGAHLLIDWCRSKSRASGRRNPYLSTCHEGCSARRITNFDVLLVVDVLKR
jgi:hypothetical protein